jgi:hypothetical protein
MNKSNKKNNLTGLEIGNPVLTRHLPIDEFFLLKQALIN